MHFSKGIHSGESKKELSTTRRTLPLPKASTAEKTAQQCKEVSDKKAMLQYLSSLIAETFHSSSITVSPEEVQYVLDNEEITTPSKKISTPSKIISSYEDKKEVSSTSAECENLESIEESDLEEQLADPSDIVISSSWRSKLLEKRKSTAS